jgi:TatD DNase family protein
MIDTHAHFDFENFNQDREEVIQRFFSQGGKAIVNVGVDLATSKKSIALAEKYENIFASVGMHPEFFSKGDWGNLVNKNDWIQKLKKMAESEKVVAIGEVGLDYFRIGESGEIGQIKERQKKGLLVQIDLAEELNLPVIVHCREAWEDLYDIISKFSQIKFVLHCYSGNAKDTEKFLELPNARFSFSGNITYPKPVERAENFAQVIRMIPLGRIMLDSDSPFLTPQKFRGKRNEPAHVRYIAEKIAKIKGISEEEAEKTTDQNAEFFFGL